ncbi:MAG: nucleotidyl transferase AbiEii/AbiGii toxin family protein [Calditrichaeota bacterium]|nr:nucleotidyl transferase AbiEii/AbiGii toxin family protein [Calditrichota bacterium]
MKRKEVKNIAVSVKDRLLALSRKNGISFQFMLLRYANERFLYRLSVSPFADRFVLKGGLLFFVWQSDFFRPTRDIDFLQFGDTDQKRMSKMFRSICSTAVPDDGLEFLGQTIAIEIVREQNNYTGFRVTLSAQLGKIHIPIRIDVGLGDVVTPNPIKHDFPVILDFPKPVLLIYPVETAIAEKLQIMIELGMANSRMKDYFDLFYIAQNVKVNGHLLIEAINKTFKQRNTPLPKKIPNALSDEFAKDEIKKKQWKAFLKKNELKSFPEDLNLIITILQEFYLPFLKDMPSK